MSHVHYINGQLESADRYQAFLERTKAVRLAEKKERARKRSGTRAFDVAIDADEEDDDMPEGSGGDPREEIAEETASESVPEPLPDPERNPEADGGPAEGFGQHYA
jgi:hypothetical protein